MFEFTFGLARSKRNCGIQSLRSRGVLFGGFGGLSVSDRLHSRKILANAGTVGPRLILEDGPAN
jgi:hypothetical protein